MKEQKKGTYFRPPIRKDFIKRVDFAETCDRSDVNALEVNITGGNVILLPSSSSALHCRIQWHHKAAVNEKIMPYVIREDTRIAVKQKRGLFSFLRYRQQNPYIVELKVPAHMAIYVKMTTGQIYVDKVATPSLQAKMRIGTIDGFSSAEKNALSLGIGSINLHGLKGDADIAIQLSATAGNVKVALPKAVCTDTYPIRKKMVLSTTRWVPLSTSMRVCGAMPMWPLPISGKFT